MPKACAQAVANPFARPPAKLCFATTAKLGPGDIAPSKHTKKRESQTVTVIISYLEKMDNAKLAWIGDELKSNLIIAVMIPNHISNQFESILVICA